MNCDLKPREPMCKLRWHVPYIECVSVGLKVLCYWSYLCMKSMSESYWILLLGSHFLGVPMNLCRSVLELKDFNVYSVCLSLDVLSIFFLFFVWFELAWDVEDFVVVVKRLL